MIREQQVYGVNFEMGRGGITIERGRGWVVLFRKLRDNDDNDDNDDDDDEWPWKCGRDTSSRLESRLVVLCHNVLDSNGTRYHTIYIYISLARDIDIWPEESGHSFSINRRVSRLYRGCIELVSSLYLASLLILFIIFGVEREISRMNLKNPRFNRRCNSVKVKWRISTIESGMIRF